MSPNSFSVAAVLLASFTIPALGQSASGCSTTLTPTNSIKPSVASGYQAALVATGLTHPRSIEFDSSGNLLVIQSGAGIESLQLQDNGGTCVSVKSKKTVVSASAVSPFG
jgi:glucose/arabinose dehydrogenase